MKIISDLGIYESQKMSMLNWHLNHTVIGTWNAEFQQALYLEDRGWVSPHVHWNLK